MSSLKEYNKKRNFNKTDEPIGKIPKAKSKDLKFVVQEHHARALHFDFRLEYNGVLLSWAVPKGPSLNPEDKRLAVKVEDHPLSYINFEGNIPTGQYGAGTVKIWDMGTYSPVKDMKTGLADGDLKLVLRGKKLKGYFKLFKMKDNNWLLVKSAYEFDNNKSTQDKIVQSKDIFLLENQEIIKLPFSQAEPMLAKLELKAPSSKDWISEIKFDGYRILSFLENGKVKLRTRNGNDYTTKFPSIVSALENLAKKQGAMILDGEIVVTDKRGKTDFSALQTAIKSSSNNFTYMIFDILAIGNTDLRKETLLARKQQLEKVIKNFDSRLVLSDYAIGKGKESFEAGKKLGLEGIICKRIDSKYSGLRNGDWIKIKCYNQQEFIIGGFIKTSKNQILSAILLGYYKDKKLVYAGKVGTGFNESMKVELYEKFKTIISKTCQFSTMPKMPVSTEVIWLKPKLVAQIQFAEITAEHNIRQGSFQGLRTDKKPCEVVLESDYEE